MGILQDVFLAKLGFYQVLISHVDGLLPVLLETSSWKICKNIVRVFYMIYVNISYHASLHVMEGWYLAPVFICFNSYRLIMAGFMSS